MREPHATVKRIRFIQLQGFHAMRHHREASDALIILLFTAIKFRRDDLQAPRAMSEPCFYNTTNQVYGHAIGTMPRPFVLVWREELGETLDKAQM